MNDVTGILVSYEGEQKKSVRPVAYVLDEKHVHDLDAGRTRMAIEHFPPRVYVCSADELEKMAAVAEGLIAGNARSEKKARPMFALTIARRGPTARAADVERIEVERAGSAAMLDAMRNAVRHPEGRQALETFRRWVR